MDINLTLGIFSISILILIIACGILYRNNLRLKVKLSSANEYKESMVEIEPGDRAIIPDYELLFEKGNDKEHHFKVTYEVEVMEVSNDKIKVKAIDFTSHDHQANDPVNRTGLIQFMENKWVPRKRVELVVDDTLRRKVKLEELLEK
jgi:hypothetical protein